jgi:hypothetical protein
MGICFVTLPSSTLRAHPRMCCRPPRREIRRVPLGRTDKLRQHQLENTERCRLLAHLPRLQWQWETSENHGLTSFSPFSFPSSTCRIVDLKRSGSWTPSMRINFANCRRSAGSQDWSCPRSGSGPGLATVSESPWSRCHDVERTLLERLSRLSMLNANMP